MRVLADDQYNKLTERIKELEDENQHLKKLLDDAGIPYDKTDKAPEDSYTKQVRICFNLTNSNNEKTLEMS